MTVEAQRPTGTPGTAPRGPAGPAPEPRAPKPSAPRPNTQKPPPSSPKQLAEHLDSITLLLRTAQLVADRKLADADPALRMALAERLRLARRAVADLQSPVRRDPEAVATHGGPVHISGRGGKVASPLASPRPVQPPVAAGECLTPGSGAALRRAVTESAVAVVARSAGVLPPAGRPPLPGGDFLLPRDVRSPVAAYGGEGGN